MELTIAPIPSDVAVREHALRLLSAGLGMGYIRGEEFARCLALGAHLDGELVGVLLGRMLEPAEAERYLALAGAALAGQRLGLLQSVAVKDGCRGRGVGTALSRAIVECLQGDGATAVLAISWESGAKNSSGRMLEAVGFRRLAHIEEFWKEDSLRRGYRCPRCGNPCRCAAVLYLNRL
jgi:GNAT superfamily N-acetyltransferase